MVDKIWHLWQKQCPEMATSYHESPSQSLPPYSETPQDLFSTDALCYSYTKSNLDPQVAQTCGGSNPTKTTTNPSSPSNSQSSNPSNSPTARTNDFQQDTSNNSTITTVPKDHDEWLQSNILALVPLSAAASKIQVFHKIIKRSLDNIDNINTINNSTTRTTVQATKEQLALQRLENKTFKRYAIAKQDALFSSTMSSNHVPDSQPAAAKMYKLEYATPINESLFIMKNLTRSQIDEIRRREAMNRELVDYYNSLNGYVSPSAYVWHSVHNHN